METPRSATERPSDTGVGVAATEEWTVRRLSQWIRTRLEERSVDSPRVAAEVLLCHVLACDRLRLYMDADRVATPDERARLRELVGRALRHEPVQYLVGEWPFRGRLFEVGPSTLIPRPSTESLVEAALAWDRTSGGGPLRMADIGSGTGILAISIVAELRDRDRSAGGKRGCTPLLGGPRSETGGSAGPQAERRIRCTAIEIVPAAAAMARRNVVRHGLSDAIEVREGSLFAPLAGPDSGSGSGSDSGLRPGDLDLVVSNPPYVSDREWEELEPNVREYEPSSALRGGPDGLDVIRPLVAEAHGWLRPGGLLLVEIGHHQRDSALALVANRSLWRSAEVGKDDEGFWRVLAATRA